MPNRRALLASTTVSVSVALAGCLNAVTGGLGEEGVSLSAQKRDILEVYERGIEESNAGSTAWNSGISLFNDQTYTDAINEFESAVEHFDEAEGLFSEAEQTANGIDETNVARLCADAVKRMGLMIEASNAGQKAAEAGADDESKSSINDHISTAQEKSEEATSIELRTTDVIAATLSDE